MTPFGRAIRRAYQLGVHGSMSDWCTHMGVSCSLISGWINADEEPVWLRTLRTIRRRTGLTWDELLDGRTRPTAMRVTTRHDEGREIRGTTCSRCGGVVGHHDRFCRHCGADFGEVDG